MRIKPITISMHLMKKFALLGFVAIALVSGAFAQTKPTKPAAPKTIKCAVMAEDDVDVAKAVKDKKFADYKGKRYFFCCDHCVAAFKKNPAKYSKSPSIPSPKPTASKTKL